MKPIVVDASVLIAGLFKDGAVRDILLNAGDHAFSAPLYLREEATRHLPRVASRSNLSIATVTAILDDLIAAVELVPQGVYSAWLAPTRDLARLAGATRDAECIALCLALEAPIWTLDKDFARIPGLRILTTDDFRHS